MAETIRVATWNIKHAAKANQYLGHPKKFYAICEGLAALNLDVLALQEVDRYVWRSGFRDLARLACKATGMTPCFGQAIGANLGSAINPGGKYGNLLLVRGGINDAYSITMDSDYKRWNIRGHKYEYAAEPRNAILAIITTNSADFSVAVTHTGGNKAINQLEATVSELMGLPGPHIVCGDMNRRPKFVKHCLESRGFSVVEGHATNRAPNPHRQIDYIAVDGDTTIQHAEPILLPISDHLALVAEIGL